MKDEKEKPAQNSNEDNGNNENGPSGPNPGLPSSDFLSGPPKATNVRSKGLAEKRNRLEYMTAWGAVIAAFGAIIAAGASTWQGNIANNTEHKSLRAYIVILTEDPATHKPFGAIDYKDSPPTAWVGYANEGQTPAYNIRVYMNALTLGVPLASDYTFPTAKNFSMDAVGPHVDVYSSMRDDTLDMTTNGDGLYFLEQFSAVFVYGTIFYDDIFGKRHFTNFCSFYFPPSQEATFCDNHNDSDDSDSDKSHDTPPN